MSRGITIRIDRTQAIRIVGEAMRVKTQQFERDKKIYPDQLAKAKKLVAARLKSLHTEVNNGCTFERLNKIVSESLFDWSRRKDIVPSRPELNVCMEKGLLLMLRQDVRKIIPINSNHELWAILQGKCEVIKA